MSDSNRKAFVYIQNKYSGVLEETDDYYIFTYDQEYLHSPNALPVSLTLPLSGEPYKSRRLFPFFDGLIPEGWLLNIVCHNWKLNINDRFGLLLAACSDCIGDVSIRGEKK